MKEFKYRSKPAEIKGVKQTTYNENYKRFRRINFPRLIYFLVLAFIAVALIYYFADRSIYVTGKGLVLSDSLQMYVDSDVEILDVKYKAGESVKKGDTLLVYASKPQANRFREYKDAMFKNEMSMKADRSLYIRDINIRKNKRDHYQRKLEKSLKDLEKLKEEVKLNISKRTDLKELNKQINSYRLEVKWLDRDVDVLKRYSHRRLKVYKDSRARIESKYARELNLIYMRSPVDGEVINVLKNAGMLAYRKDAVIELNNGEGVAIVAYFSQRDLHYLKSDNKVKVYFSDGFSSYGYISEISEPMIYYDSSGEPQVSKDMKIKVKIIPEEGDAEKWNVRKGYFVKVKRLRNFFN